MYISTHICIYREESPIAPLRKVRTSSLTGDLLDSLRKCLSIFFQNREDNFKKDDLLDVITEQVRPVSPEEFLRFIEEENRQITHT
jgi:hypothetical protein